MTDDKWDASFHDPDPIRTEHWATGGQAPGALPQRDPYRSFAEHGAPPETPHPHAPVSPGRAPWAYSQGGPVQHPVWGTGQAHDARPNSGVAVAALVTGIVGALAGWCLFGLPCIAAVVLGHIGVNQTKDDAVKGRGMAVAGLVLGYASMIPAAIVILYTVLGLGGAAVAPALTPSPLPSISF